MCLVEGFYFNVVLKIKNTAKYLLNYHSENVTYRLFLVFIFKFGADMIALIDYGMGNLSSVHKAFSFTCEHEIKITDSKNDILDANAIILPGVGNFGDGIKHLRERKLDDSIIKFINSGRPFFGICLGMQMLFERSEEANGVNGLGVIDGDVVKFSEKCGLKVPQMGWNSVTIKKKSDFFNEINESEYFYFVHSYYVRPCDISTVATTTDYTLDFCSSILIDNIFATQFHPEKSQSAGLKLISNFLKTVK